MTTFKLTTPIQANDPNLEITVSVEPEDDSPHGHFDSGDADADAQLVRDICESYNAGNEYAWCWVRVTATYTDPTTGEVSTGEDTLGAVSCLRDDDRDMSAAQCFEELIGPKEYDMRANALADLNEKRESEAYPTKRAFCTTAYMGATDTRGSHILARGPLVRGRRKTVRVAYDYALDALENHILAARKIFGGAYPTDYAESGPSEYTFMAALAPRGEPDPAVEWSSLRKI